MGTLAPRKPAAVSLNWNVTMSSTKTTSSTSRSLSFSSRTGWSLPSPTSSSGTPLRAAAAAPSASEGPSVLMPSVRITIVAGGVPRRSSSTPWMAAPSRVLSPFGEAARQLGGDAGRVGMRGGLQPGEEVEAELVVPGDFRQHRGVVLRQQRAGQVPAAELQRPLAAADAGAARAFFQGLAQPRLIAVHHGHAQRVVDQHGHVGQTGALQGDRHLGDHQHRQGDQRQPHDRQYGAVAAAGAAAFPRVDRRHEKHRPRHQQQRHPGRPGPLVIEPPVRTLPRPGLDVEPSFQPGWQGAAHVP